MKLEIVHVRDSDGGCDVTLFVNGVPISVDETIDIDPGRSGSPIEWSEAMQDVRGNAFLTAAARDFALEQWQAIVGAVYSVTYDTDNVCPTCGTDEWDFRVNNQAECVNGHRFDVAEQP